jgi:hypothetical protein
MWNKQININSIKPGSLGSSYNTNHMGLSSRKKTTDYVCGDSHQHYTHLISMGFLLFHLLKEPL